ncbi:hypothetical protein Bequi_03985 [Brachybacterium sp. JHP9]|uniref:Phosphoglyceromutase n=1 Tax=Brachybacterium equifaecis TaxID=2910770 RepID=A0ABT0QY11_9MICO|nr:hypothetical protein [Brachybacterium equifaecis]MCL6422551.1 hypothetical protein [Brachybacterium equifaecis]
MPRSLPLSTARGRLLGLLLLALAAAAALLAPLAAADGSPGEDGGAGSSRPVRLVLLTAGLTWEDVSPSATPHLACLADRSSAGAMSTTSTTPRSTQAQGMESVRTGYRGLAAEAAPSAGIPSPAVDQLEQLPVPVVEIGAGAALPDALPADALVLADLGALSPAGSSPAGTDRAQQLAALDARAGAVLDLAGGCEAVGDPASGAPRTLLLSVAELPDDSAPDGPGSAPDGPADPVLPGRAAASLQVAADSADPGGLLTSGSTHQSGVVVLTDVAPTILASYGITPVGPLPGQPFLAEKVSTSPLVIATDRTQAARLVDAATVPALGSWLALGLIGLVLRLVPAAARRPRLLRLSRALMAIAPLALPVGLYAGLVPWWRAGHPALALTGWVWAGSIVLSAIVLLGPWRRSRFGPLGVSSALVAGLILLECAAGSPWQLGSPLGAQAISGGRYYGMSNHLFGLVLAASLAALLCLFTRVLRPRSRALWTIGTWLVIAGICVAPTMGADFGSMLVTVPTFGLLALLVAGIRLRLWHVLALGVGGGAAVMGVSLLDWLRPPAARTHLGRFIDQILSGELAGVIVRKFAQNLGMLLGIPVLALIVALALAGSIAALMPRRLRWRSLAALDAALPIAYPVRIALVAGGWLGYLVNDTGPVLIAAMLGLWVLALGQLLPTGGEDAAGAAGPPQAPVAAHQGPGSV